MWSIMRVWNEMNLADYVENICWQNIETLCVWSVITNNKKGYSKHPETVRYRHNLNALVYRHIKLVHETQNVDIILRTCLILLTYPHLM